MKGFNKKGEIKGDVYHIDIEKATIEGNSYREVLYTTPDKDLQITIMSIIPGGNIGLEMHDNVNQFIRVEKGTGIVVKKGKKGKRGKKLHDVKDGSAIVIPKGTWHNIVNTGAEPLQLYSIYTPANHPTDRLQKNKPKEAEHHGGGVSGGLNNNRIYANKEMDPYYHKYMAQKIKYFELKESISGLLYK